MGVALAHGVVLAMMISALGKFSGGHFNPAVTIAFALTGRVKWGDAGAYILSQVVGGFGLAALYPAHPNLGATIVAASISPAQAAVMEFILTLPLATAIWGTAVDSKGSGQLAGFGIGLVVTVDILAGGPLTGASMNPARTFGPMIATGNWADLWVYLAGPILGAAAAAFVYDKVLNKD